MVGTALVIGGVLGVRHALEADHIAAVATLVEDNGRPASAGAAWGIGHSLPILLLGATFLVLDLRIPPTVATVFEGLVAVILIALGVRVLFDREALGSMILRHIHHTPNALTKNGHLHASIAGKDIGLTHSHTDEESLAVGVVHGLAGSGGIVVILATAAPTVPSGAAFLLGFAAASILAMGLAAWSWGHALGRSASLKKVAAVASISVGVFLMAEIIGVGLPF